MSAKKTVRLMVAVQQFLQAKSDAAEFSESLGTVRRENVPIAEVEETEGLVVTVFPGVRTPPEDATLGRMIEARVSVEELSLEKSAAAHLAREDAIIDLSEEIEEALYETSFEDIGGGLRAAFQEFVTGGGLFPLDAVEMHTKTVIQALVIALYRVE